MRKDQREIARDLRVNLFKQTVYGPTIRTTSAPPLSASGVDLEGTK